jgi:hypothetical protein
MFHHDGEMDDEVIRKAMNVDPVDLKKPNRQLKKN